MGRRVASTCVHGDGFYGRSVKLVVSEIYGTSLRHHLGYLSPYSMQGSSHSAPPLQLPRLLH